MTKSTISLIALGANLPNDTAGVGETLRMTASILHEISGITITRISRFWKTPAFPPGAGPDYVNAALMAQVSLPAQALMAELHRIESDFGRDRRTGRWSARSLDLDLLAYGEQIAPDPATFSHWQNLPLAEQQMTAPQTLILPHPRMQDRGFVLAPLAEIAPAWMHPVIGKNVAQMLSELPADAMAGAAPLSWADMAALP